MDPRDEVPQDGALHVPFVFVPEGAAGPGAWRAAHPGAVSLPARLVVRSSGVATVRRNVPAMKLQLAQWWLPPLILSKPPILPPRPMARIPRQSGKEAATDTPSWARGISRNVGETPDQYAHRLMDGQFGRGRWQDDPTRMGDFRKIKKFSQRAFQDPGMLLWLPDVEEPPDA